MRMVLSNLTQPSTADFIGRHGFLLSPVASASANQLLLVPLPQLLPDQPITTAPTGAVTVAEAGFAAIA